MASMKPAILRQDQDSARPLSAREQFQCARKAVEGDEPENLQAREQLILSMKGLILRIAHSDYNIQHSQLDDVLQECYLVLLKIFSPPDKNSSIKARFNPSLKVKPSTYAVFWIHFAIQNFFYRERAIRVPRDLGYWISQFEEFTAGSEEMSTKEVEAFIAAAKPGRNISARRLKNALVSRAFSLDRIIDGGGGATFLDILEDKDSFPSLTSLRRERRINIIRRAMEATLNEREAKIISFKYGVGYTNWQIAGIFGISGSRVGQILAQAKRKIKRWILEQYPDLKN